MTIPTPMPLALRSPAFDDPEWIYEIKHDGFRAFAVIEGGQCRFISRNKCKLYGLRDLAAALDREVNAETTILDGELAVPDHPGRTVFAAMMKRRHEAQYFGFDLLALNGEGLRQLPSCWSGSNACDAFYPHDREMAEVFDKYGAGDPD